jgi:flagellar protein FliO/FliZ
MLAASTLELGLRMSVSLALMGVVALVVVKVLRGRLKLGPARAGLAVEARHQLNRSTSVAVIRAGQRYFLLGLSEQSVTLLAEGDDLVAAAPVAASRPVATAPANAPTPDAIVNVEPAAVDVRPRSDIGRAKGAAPAQLRARGADGASTSDAGKGHRRATGPAPSGMSVIEALREKTVRR